MRRINWAFYGRKLLPLWRIGCKVAAVAATPPVRITHGWSTVTLRASASQQRCFSPARNSFLPLWFLFLIIIRLQTKNLYFSPEGREKNVCTDFFQHDDSVSAAVWTNQINSQTVHYVLLHQWPQWGVAVKMFTCLHSVQHFRHLYLIG